MTHDPTSEPPFDDESDLIEDEDLADEDADDEAHPAVAARPDERSHGAPRHRSAPMGAAGARRDRRRGIDVDPSLRIRDRWSEAFVVGTVLVFALVFFNALAFGNGGALSPSPTPRPSVIASAGPSASPVKTPAPIQTEFQVPTHSPGPSASVAPSPS